MERLAQKSGAFTVDYARTDEELKAKLARGARDAYAGVFFAQTSGDLPIPDPQGFLDWIAAGHGFVGIHSATDTFPGFAPFIEMLGGALQAPRPAGEGRRAGEGRGAPVDQGHPAAVRGVRRDLPVRAATTPRACIFFCTCRSTPRAASPASSRSPGRATHGKGRVFYTALGHREDVLDAEWYGAHLLGRHRRGPWGGK